MKIARRVVTLPNEGVGAAIKMVKDADDLSVEDILPLFPDSVVIGEFRDELRATLDKYDMDIEVLMCQMEDKT